MNRRPKSWPEWLTLIAVLGDGRGGSDGDPQETVTVIDGGGGPCGEGYSLIGDICEPTPEGYVETRSECEMGVDSREAAGVEQDYQAELEKCRNAGPPVP